MWSESWDKLQSEGKWEESLELFADTATVTYQNGQTVKASEMTEMARKKIQTTKLTTLITDGHFRVLFL